MILGAPVLPKAAKAPLYSYTSGATTNWMEQQLGTHLKSVVYSDFEKYRVEPEG
jgi:hypothetical protein